MEKLNTEGRIGFFDIKAVENRLRALVDGKASNTRHLFVLKNSLRNRICGMELCGVTFLEFPDNPEDYHFIMSRMRKPFNVSNT